MERTSGYVLVTPLDDEDVVATFLNQVANAVLIVADMADAHLLTRQLRSHHPNHQHVDACNQLHGIISWDTQLS